MEAFFAERENPLVTLKTVRANVYYATLADLFVEASYLFLTLAVFADYSAEFFRFICFTFSVSNYIYSNISTFLS